MKKSQAVAQGPRANESRHTPGPWYALKYPDVKTYTVAAKESVASKIKTIEDAHLIAAAPDLKSIAELFFKVLGGEISLASINRDSVAKAIAKAEGRSE